MPLGYGLDPYGLVAYGSGPSLPTVRIEIGFTDPWFAVDPVWTDISDYVQSLDSQYGRDNEIGSIEAGTMTLVLDNGDGRFTPGRSTSPYYPNVKPRRPVRAVATLGGLDYPIWRGLVEAWPTTTAAGATQVTIQCVDALSPLAKMPLTNPYLYEASKHSLVEIFPMNDEGDRFSGLLNPTDNYLTPTPASSNQVVVAQGNDAPTVETQGTDLLPNFTGSGSAGVSGTVKITSPVATGSGIAFVSGAFPYDLTPHVGDFTVSMFHTLTNPVMNEPVLVFRVEDAGSSEMLWEVFFTPSKTAPSFTVYYRDRSADAGVGVIYSDLADAATVNGTNHIEVTYSHDTGGTYPNERRGLGLFVNGQGGYTAITASGVKGGATGLLDATGNYRLVVGSLLHTNEYLIGDSSMIGSDFQVEMISIHNQVFSQTDRDALQLAASGMGTQRVADRLNYLLDQLNWPAELRDIEASDIDSEILFLGWEDAPKALDELRSPVLDSNGLLFVGPDGKITYQSRFKRMNPTPAYIFDEDAGTGAEAPLDFELSETDIQNIAEVDNAFGVKATIRNEASITEYGEASTDRTTRLASDDEALQAAWWLVNRFGDARLRLDGVALNPAAQADGLLWPPVLNLRLSDCIGLRNLPGSAPDQETNFIVEQISHSIARNGETLEWFTTLQVSPATGREGWLLGNPLRSILGFTTILHY